MFGDDKQSLTALLRVMIDKNITDFAKFRQDLVGNNRRPLGRGHREKRSIQEDSDEDETERPPIKKLTKAIRDARRKEANNLLKRLKQWHCARTTAVEVNLTEVVDHGDRLDTVPQSISDVIVSRCSRDTAQKFVNDLMNAMYSSEHMVLHSVSGIKSSKTRPHQQAKPALDKQDVRFIIDQTKAIFAERREVEIKASIRLKLNNEAKKFAGRTS